MYIPSKKSERQFITLPFTVSRGHLHSLACDFFFHLQSQHHSIFKSLTLTMTTDLPVSLFTDTDPLITLGPSKVSWLPVLILFATLILSCQLQVLGSRMWKYLTNYYSVYPTTDEITSVICFTNSFLIIFLRPLPNLHFSLGGLGAYIFCGFLNYAHNHEKAVILKVWHQYQHRITWELVISSESQPHIDL